jgi:signal transduction histidine kinase/CheY-like chemotaxis protein
MQQNVTNPQPEITDAELATLFRMLDIVNVSSLWVDKNFQHYKYNDANKFIKESVLDLNGRWVPYTELIYEIYHKNHVDTGQDDARSYQQNWISKLREQQKTPLTPSEDCVILSASGKRFTSRRVFLPDGSLLVVSFEYTELLQRDDIIKIAFNLSKSGALCYTAGTDEFFIESPYLERILTPEEHSAVRNEGMFAIIHPNDRESSREIFIRSLVSKIPISKNIRIKTKNHGNLWFKFTGRLEKNNDEKLRRHILTFEDVTEELKIQENLRQHIHKSENELKERLDFIAKLSHELKTPMNAIVGLSDALLHDEITDKTRKKLELIQLSSGNLLGMLDDTLNHAKLKSANATLDLQYVNAKKVIGDICKLWEHQALKKGTIIRFHPNKSLPKLIKLDSIRIGQCLNNLLSNASKFTEYGQIDVIIQPHYAENKPDQLAIAVRDTGIGMTKEQQNKVFDAYKQANETISTRFGGTGLGLSITKDLVKLMGGEITVISKPEKGSMFLIVLPMDAHADANTQTPETAITPPLPQQKFDAAEKLAIAHRNETNDISKSPLETKRVSKQPFIQDGDAYSPAKKIIRKAAINAGELEKLNILVVDDNETNHIVMSSLLENVVGGIYSAYNGQEALNVLAVEHIDVVLMDIHMPVMDGIEATIAIRQSPEAFSNVRIIALTADPQYQQQRLCVNIGMDEAIAKPVKLVDLIDIIKKTLAAPVNMLSKAS